jgi:hypothetical protein
MESAEGRKRVLIGTRAFSFRRPSLFVSECRGVTLERQKLILSSIISIYFTFNNSYTHRHLFSKMFAGVVVHAQRSQSASCKGSVGPCSSRASAPGTLIADVCKEASQRPRKADDPATSDQTMEQKLTIMSPRLDRPRATSFFATPSPCHPIPLSTTAQHHPHHRRPAPRRGPA